ncbi:uncharacterized protein BJ171DRAFT_8659 [Polychytrium aggregatum]|uniref:uncharacterized protein n=1 Tax=Polychytrium aggregatum TaxID=110093 RepID=UPI0022FEEEF1|nr:uncharacterized protein BJ171DRAFT_8659 [Polychytrium aggregatum]KAI9209849.1 hypothetical protein BJ171DRAFT_8659 [Polychytrium aggregatum]
MEPESITTEVLESRPIPKPVDTHAEELAFHIFQELLDDSIRGVIFQCHREHKLANVDCQICKTRCRCYVSQPGLDIYGNASNQVATEKCECPSCFTSFPPARFAPHLEKCLGLGRGSTRNSRRAAPPNSGSAPPSSPSNTHENSDSEREEKKRKRKTSPTKKQLSVKPVKRFKSLSTTDEYEEESGTIPMNLSQTPSGPKQIKVKLPKLSSSDSSSGSGARDADGKLGLMGHKFGAERPDRDSGGKHLPRQHDVLRRKLGTSEQGDFIDVDGTESI